MRQTADRMTDWLLDYGRLMTTTGSATRPIRPVLAIVGATLFFPGLIFAVAAIAVALRKDPGTSADIELISDAAVIVLGCAPAAIGGFLLHKAAPDLPRGLVQRLSSLVSVDGWRSGVRWLAGVSLGRTLIGLAIVAAASLVTPH